MARMLELHAWIDDSKTLHMVDSLPYSDEVTRRDSFQVAEHYDQRT
jgi:hypothetical protein